MATRIGEALIGREHPVAVLRAEVERATDSHGGLVLVTGEPGIGKTTLVTGAADEARRRGALVVGGACWASDSAPGYWPWVQVLRGLRRAPDDWAAAQEAAGPGLAVVLGEIDVDEPSDPFQVYDAVTSALVAVSQRRPLVVVLDDLHWADTASLRLLEFVAQHTWFERLLLLGTYRDAEVEVADHPLRPLMMPLVTKATTVTLTGLERDDVGALMVRTAGREPDAALVDEVHRRTGGNPFFVEQTARLWHADGAITAIAPGVREAVRQRLAQLPGAVVDALTAAAVLGREFHRQVLAATAAAPAAEVDRLLDRAVTARLVVGRGGGTFTFAHDLVRETLYDGLSDDDRCARHAAVIHAVDRLPAIADRLLDADIAHHAYLAVPVITRTQAADRLLEASRSASSRLAVEEAVAHLRRALEVADDGVQQVKIMIELGQLCHHAGDNEETRDLFDRAATVALGLDEPLILARIALTVYRHKEMGGRRPADVESLVREAHRRLIGDPEPGASVRGLVADLITVTETMARRGDDDEALTFSLWARHDTTWGLGTAADRAALTVEIRDLARRAGDVEAEMFATSLRWVALLELGDPAYFDELKAFVAMGREGSREFMRLATSIDGSIIATFRGDFAEAEALLVDVRSAGEIGHSDYAFMFHHLRWALLLMRGAYDEVDALLAQTTEDDHPYLELLETITAAERGDGADAVRRLVAIESAGRTFPRPMSPLVLRMRAQVAAATGDPARIADVRAALLPYRGDFTVSMFGCDVSGPVDHWLGLLDAAERRWDDAIERFEAARDGADRMGSRPWSVIARGELARALAARGDAEEAAATRAGVVRDAGRLGMSYVVERLGPGAAEVTPAPTAADEFRRDGPVWQLAYAGTVVHLPDAKGLQDLHLLLSRPGVDVPAVELLDPAAGPELVAARRMGGDPVLDDEAKARYRSHLALLDDEIDRAATRGDTDRVDALDAERVALLAELRSAAGLAGRTRRLGDQGERARKTVTARIRDVLRKLDSRHPALAAHLRESVSTGATCRYAPSGPPPAWQL
jgi:hypothetical protein